MITNNKLHLVTAITLLYRESLLATTDRSTALVKEVLGRIKLPELSLGIDHERDILQGLKNTALEMCEAPIGQTYGRKEMLQRLKMVTYEDQVTYLALEDGIREVMDEKQAYLSCTQLRRMLENAMKEAGFQKLLEKYSYQYKFERESIKSISELASNFITELETYTIGLDKAIDPALINHVDFRNREQVQQVFNEVKDVANGDGMFRTGQQGLNRMLQGGFRPGESWVFAAMQHNYKTGMALDIFHDCCVYNTPHLYDPTKKPAILYFSMENDLRVNFEFLYRLMYELETGQKASIDDKTTEELSEFVTERLERNGFHVHMLRYRGSDWSYRGLCNKIIEFESMGYEIKACFADYLALIPTVGCTQGAQGDARRDQFRRVRDFMNPRKIFFFTPHQLNSSAKDHVRAGSQELVKSLPNGGYLMECRTLENEVDGELYGHIEKANGEKYYTIQRGKHRIPTILPEKDHFMVWKFLPVGNLGRDIFTEEHTRKKVGGGVVGSKDVQPFWSEETADQPF